VIARFYGEWYPAYIRSIHEGSIEVLWASELSVSMLSPCDVVPATHSFAGVFVDQSAIFHPAAAMDAPTRGSQWLPSLAAEPVAATDKMMPDESSRCRGVACALGPPGLTEAAEVNGGGVTPVHGEGSDDSSDASVLPRTLPPGVTVRNTFLVASPEVPHHARASSAPPSRGPQHIMIL